MEKQSTMLKYIKPYEAVLELHIAQLVTKRQFTLFLDEKANQLTIMQPRQHKPLQLIFMCELNA